jgi:hypothetical protein
MLRTLLVLVALCLCSLPGFAGDKKGKGHGHGNDSARDGGAVVAVSVFIGADREIIHEYVDRHQGDGLPPGLAKRGGDLPPGLRKHLRKTGTLPPGLQKKLAPFPPELEARLRPLRPGLRRAFVEGRAVIYDGKTSVVLDVFIPF